MTSIRPPGRLPSSPGREALRLRLHPVLLVRWLLASAPTALVTVIILFLLGLHDRLRVALSLVVAGILLCSLLARW